VASEHDCSSHGSLASHLAHQQCTALWRCPAGSHGLGWGAAGRLQARVLMGRPRHHRWEGSCRDMGAAGWALAGRGQFGLTSSGGGACARRQAAVRYILKPWSRRRAWQRRCQVASRVTRESGRSTLREGGDGELGVERENAGLLVWVMAMASLCCSSVRRSFPCF
jgi:hypothetical protein